MVPWEGDSVAGKERHWGVREVIWWFPEKYDLLIHTYYTTTLTQEEENRYIKKNTVEWKGSINIKILTPQASHLYLLDGSLSVGWMVLMLVWQTVFSLIMY